VLIRLEYGDCQQVRTFLQEVTIMSSQGKHSFSSPGKRSLVTCLTIIVLLLTGCSPQVSRQAPPFQPEGGFSGSGQEQLPEQWWLTFEDQTLDSLISRALAGNFSLQTAWDRVDRAYAVARKAGAALVPQVDADIGLGTQKSRINSRTDSSQSYNLGLAASYEVDLWGRIDSLTTAAELDAQASTEELQTAALTISAQVAATWFQLLEQRGQIVILEQQIRTNEKTLEIISLQFRTGQVGIADVLQQRQVVETQRGELALTTGRAQVRQNQLAILLGISPIHFSQSTTENLDALPPLPATGLQSDLIENRPDVRAAWLKLQAADKRVAAAVADRFPRLSLTGRANTTSEEIENLFDDWLASLAANLLTPIIDGGRRRAEVERTESVASEALHQYGQTVLDALLEVEDALTREEKQLEYLVSVDRQLELAGQATERIRDRYLNGAEDYQRVLTSLISEQRLQRTRLTAKRELFENRVTLCRALAGGWELTRQPEQTPLRGE
jgi:NodT family efflux transporter outer membrane factor (OMF) lipoprotein